MNISILLIASVLSSASIPESSVPVPALVLFGEARKADCGELVKRGYAVIPSDAEGAEAQARAYEEIMKAVRADDRIDRWLVASVGSSVPAERLVEICSTLTPERQRRFQALSDWDSRIRFLDGHGWRNRRVAERTKVPPVLARAEAKRFFEDNVYGRRPVERPEGLAFRDLVPPETVYGGLGVKRTVEISWPGTYRAGRFTVQFYRPARVAKPVPAFAFLALHPIQPDVVKHEEWPVRTILERGFATVAFRYTEVAPDWGGEKPHDGFRSGVYPCFERPEDRTPQSWGAISAWAWGLSRALDFLETVPEVDATRVMTVGLSRGGKTALWAAAADERFAGACATGSGCCGAAMNAIFLPGEDMNRIHLRFPYWFCGAFERIAKSSEQQFPGFDQHQMLAMIAPRRLYVSDGLGDTTRYGDFEGVRFAAPAWAAAGFDTLADAEFPPPGSRLVAGRTAYHLRRGPHDLTFEDWIRYIDFATEQFKSGRIPEGCGASESERLLTTWSKALVGLQVSRPDRPELDGGVLCPSCAAFHGRTMDAVWPLCWLWRRTGDEGYLTAAKRLLRWSRLNLERPDGAYLNDPNMGWRGTTIFAQTALGRVLDRWGGELDAATREEWLGMFRRQTAWCRRWMDDPDLVVNVNYRAGYALAMELAYRVLKDGDCRASGDAQAKRVLGCIAADGLLFGEAKPLEYVSPRGLRGVDIGYNVEETLPALLEWAELRGDDEALGKFLDCAETHLWFILPDGGVDNSFGSRAYKWSYWGSRTSDGILPMLSILVRHGRTNAVTAFNRTLGLYSRCTTATGLLSGGLNYAEADEPTCVHHSFCHLKTLPQAIESNVPACGGTPLPADGAFGLKRFPTAGVALAGVGPWRASFSENDVYFVDDNGKSTGGGSMTLLYHRALGPVFAASMPAWSVIERMSMQEQTKDDVTRCLTPRLESGSCMSVYDDRVRFEVSGDAGGVRTRVRGCLTDRQDRPMEKGTFGLSWTLDAERVSVEATTQSAATLVLPVLADGSSRVELQGCSAVVFRTNGCVTVTANRPIAFERSVRPNGLSFSPQTGFLAAYLTIPVAAGETTAATVVASGKSRLLK